MRTIKSQKNVNFDLLNLNIDVKPMMYIEVSKKINLTKEATDKELKEALLNRLRRAFDVKALEDKKSGFSLIGSTSGYMGMTHHARADLDVSVVKSQQTVRVIVTGYAKMAKSLMVTYTVLFFLILLAGLLPGSIETSAETSGAMDALVFLIFGIFTYYDINRKMHEPKEFIQAALDSLDTEFG